MTGPVLLSASLLCSVCVIRRQSPVRLMMLYALHMRAAWTFAGVVRGAIAGVLPRYRECLDAAKREVL